MFQMKAFRLSAGRCEPTLPSSGDGYSMRPTVLGSMFAASLWPRIATWVVLWVEKTKAP